MPVTEIMNREGRRGHGADDDSHLLATEDDFPTMMKAMPEWAEKTADAWPLPYPALQTPPVSPHTLEGSPSTICPSLRPTSQPFSGLLLLTPGGLNHCKQSPPAHQVLLTPRLPSPARHLA